MLLPKVWSCLRPWNRSLHERQSVISCLGLVWCSQIWGLSSAISLTQTGVNRFLLLSLVKHEVWRERVNSAIIIQRHLSLGWVQAPPLKIVVCFGVCNLMIIQLLNSALERYHSFFNYAIYSLLTKSRYFTLPRRIIVGQLSSSAIESSWLSSSEKSVSSKQHVATV